MAAPSASVPVLMLSDPICPWCYIGKHRLDQAMAARPGHALIRIWRPFQLNPDMPAEGMDREAYLHAKFGGPEGAKRVYGAIEEAARADGLDVRFDRIGRTPNTLDAHRVMRWAETVDGQDEASDRLFALYFIDGQDISDRDLLADVAAAAGLDRDETARRLATDEDLDVVRSEDRAAREAGVDGVPTYIVANQHVVPGAQPTELWIRVIDDINRAAAQAAAEGELGAEG